MPLRDSMDLVSVDDHIVEHPRVWLDRLPRQYQEAGPRIIEVERVDTDATTSGENPMAECWVYEGRIIPTIAINAVAGRPREEFGLEPYRFDQILRGCWDMPSRIRDMDLDGIQSQLCFPTFPGFAGKNFLASKDKELGLLCMQAWNDFSIDEVKGADPSRFIAPVILPIWDAELAVREIERTAAKGAQTISFPENPEPLGFPSFRSDYWDPIFGAAADHDLPLSMHFGTSTKVPSPSPDAPFMAAVALYGTNSMFTMVDLVFSPVFHRNPNLKVTLAEGGTAWFPYLVERLDYTWERHRYYQNVNQDVRPSELVRNHIWSCFIEDRTGIELRHKIGIDRIMWECDYPHSDSNWPNSRKLLAEQLQDVPDDEVRMLVELNARALFNHPAVN